MAEKEIQSAARRRRVQNLKRLIIIVLITSILIPTVLCVILFIKMNQLQNQIEQLQSVISETAQASIDLNDMEVNDSPGFIMEPSNTEDKEALKTAEDDKSTDGINDPDKKAEEEDTRKIYLTFDDGPSSNTNKILDILAEYDVKATFFVIGKEGEWAEEAYLRIVEEGHTLGMHSYTHEYNQIYESVESFEEDLNKLQEYLYNVTGVWSRYLRFPGGSSNKVSKVDMKDLIAYLNEEGFTYYDWNISSKDASRTILTGDEIINNCLDGIEKYNTVIILMHDAAGRNTTVEALPGLIEKIQSMENTELLPISEDTVPVQHITIKQGETED